MGRATIILNTPQAKAKVCANCGGTFHRDVRNTYAYWEKAKFCSRKCTGEYNTKRAAVTRKPMSVAFEEKVTKTDGCWEWKGLFGVDGYPLLPWARKMYRANRVSVLLSGREIGKGQLACHTCDNPKCVNPDHLFVGTNMDNVRDAISKGRHVHGAMTPLAKLTEDEAKAIKSSNEKSSVLADRYGISVGSVNNILASRTWKHLP